MIKVFEILEEEKQEAINIANEKRHDTNVGLLEKSHHEGIDTVVIMRATGFTKEEIEEIRNNMLTTK